MKLIWLCCRRKVVILTILRFLLLLASIWSLPCRRVQSSSIQLDQYWLCYWDLLLTCVWLSQVVPRVDGATNLYVNCGHATGYTFTVDASVVEQRNETITASCQSSVLYSAISTMSNADREEAAARHCDQLAQVLFAARGTFPRNPLRKSHLATPHFTNLFGLQNNMHASNEGKQGIWIVPAVCGGVWGSISLHIKILIMRLARKNKD